MRVSVYATDGYPEAVLVEASPGKGRAPLLLTGITPGNLLEKVSKAVNRMRQPRATQPDPVG